MRTAENDEQELEIALLRRGVGALVATRVRCDGCGRTPLLGERLYAYEADLSLCELCRGRESRPPTGSGIVHGPAFGSSLRISDRRAA